MAKRLGGVLLGFGVNTAGEFCVSYNVRLGEMRGCARSSHINNSTLHTTRMTDLRNDQPAGPWPPARAVLRAIFAICSTIPRSFDLRPGLVCMCIGYTLPQAKAKGMVYF
jgi:hypothetical protein